MTSRAMTSRANVKPLMHWVIYKGYTVRITARQADGVQGILTTPVGSVDFRYDAAAQIVHLPDATVAINAYGWELDAPATAPTDASPSDTDPADTNPADTNPADTNPADTGPTA